MAKNKLGTKGASQINDLSVQAIWQVLPTDMQNHYEQILLFDTLPSTNDYLLNLDADDAADKPFICLADRQTAGKGRIGKTWISPAGCNIYLSIRYLKSQIGKGDKPFSFRVGEAVLSVLQAYGQAESWRVKSPNDVLYGDKKVAGCLVETKADFVVIGIGINVNLLPDAARQIDQPWTSLQQITGQTIDRSGVVAEILTELMRRMLVNLVSERFKRPQPSVKNGTLLTHGLNADLLCDR